ncbi:MAG: hypothetical protein Q8O48_13055 [Anaerolineales bacterium]|nr:hypothetical protein [Anaerolineales bacterium]
MIIPYLAQAIYITQGRTALVYGACVGTMEGAPPPKRDELQSHFGGGWVMAE